MVTEEELEHYMKAGVVSAEALEFGSKLIRPGMPILETVDKIEEFIQKKGCGMAFPVNISMNASAAHDTAFPGETRLFKDEVVKLDIGAHSDGFIGDNAMTIDLSGKYSDLMKASREALNNAIKMVQIGTALGEIGNVIEETIQSYGYQPVRNLSGHQLSQYTQHFGISVPNYASGEETELKKGMFIAIEPFATNGMGMITEKGDAGIFSQIGRKPVRDPTTRQILAQISTYNGLPFASLWLARKFPVFRVKLAMRDLVNAGTLHAYPPLVEKSDGIVSQAEHTLFIDDKVVVLTKGNFNI